MVSIDLLLLFYFSTYGGTGQHNLITTKNISIDLYCQILYKGKNGSVVGNSSNTEWSSTVYRQVQHGIFLISICYPTIKQKWRSKFVYTVQDERIIIQEILLLT